MIEELKQDLKDWILDWVSVYNEQLGTIPCPFAKQALLTNKIDYATAQDLDGAEGLCKAFAAGMIKNEMLIIGMPKEATTSDNLSTFVKRVNSTVLMPAGLVALEDHPDDEEVIHGVKMNQGKWILIFMQSLEKINQASLILQKQGYYDNWTAEDFDDVVSWRFEKE